MNLQTLNVGIRTLLANVINAVGERSNGKQKPQKLEDLRQDFVFAITNTPTLNDNFITTTKKFIDLPFAEMAFIKGGSFEMGSNEYSTEKPIHNVTVSDFWMGKYAVTVKQYLAFCEATHSHYPAWLESGSEYNINTGTHGFYKALGTTLTSENYPIIGISHIDAEAFCEWLSRREGITYRLPTEAEWEYAAGNGSVHTKYSCGETEPTYKNENLDSASAGYSFTSPVGTYGTNQFGLYDISGNVWEWCRDWYGAYEASPSINPTGAITGEYRVMRGGGWNFSPQCSRIAVRFFDVPTYRSSYIGFRVVSP